MGSLGSRPRKKRQQGAVSLAPKPDVSDRRESVPMIKSTVTTIYDKGEYIAQHHSRSGVVVVCRHYMIGERKAATHVGEKHESEDWREVRLRGCPDDVRREIIEAWGRFQEEYRK